MASRTAFLLCLSLALTLAAVLWLLYIAAAFVDLAFTYHRHRQNQLLQNLHILEQDNQRQLDEFDERIQELENILSQAEIYTVTAYTSFCGNGDGLSATGTVPSRGRTIAVDPRKIKLGSQVWVEGLGVLTAEDTGGKIKGNRLDYYIGESREEASAFGRQRRKVVVVGHDTHQ